MYIGEGFSRFNCIDVDSGGATTLFHPSNNILGSAATCLMAKRMKYNERWKGEKKVTQWNKVEKKIA